MDPSGFVLLSDFIPQIVQEIRYYSTYNYIGDRIDGYEEPCALLTKAVVRNGFMPLDCERWHFALSDEPYPDTYFEFPVSSAYLKK